MIDDWVMSVVMAYYRGERHPDITIRQSCRQLLQDSQLALPLGKELDVDSLRAALDRLLLVSPNARALIKQLTPERSPSVNQHVRVSGSGNVVTTIGGDAHGLVLQVPRTSRSDSHSTAAKTKTDSDTAETIPFILHLKYLGENRIAIQAITTPTGEPSGDSVLPYELADIIALLRALEPPNFVASLTQEQRQRLRRLELLRNDRRLAYDALIQAGKALYTSLLPGKIGAAFDVAYAQARMSNKRITLQLRFDPDEVLLAQYPWELLHVSDHALVASGQVELIRYVAYSEPPPSENRLLAARFLYIAPRPKGLDVLSDVEHQNIRAILQTSHLSNQWSIDTLQPARYDILLDQLAKNQESIIHFDGHGEVARCCPVCKTLNSASTLQCLKPECREPIDDIPPEGLLVFEKDNGEADYISTAQMRNALTGRQVQLAVLSSCKSGTVRGTNTFSAMGPGLISAGIPAVVAMQSSILASDAAEFAKGFYSALAAGNTVAHAVTEGRRRLFRSNAWFLPTLYLRSRTDP